MSISQPSRQRARIKGVLAPVLTPFTRTLEPDAQRFIEHAHWLVDSGAGLALFGTNSEAASLTIEERIELTDRLLDAGLPAAKMMPGTGCCAVADTVRLTRHAVEHGAAGVLMLPPYYFKGLTDDGLFAYYADVIERVGDERLSLYLYHIPQVSGVPIPLTLIERLLKRYPGVVAGAKDSSGDWKNSEQMIKAFGKEGFDVFPASEIMLSQALAIGGAGCISATVNINPAGIQAVYAATAEERARVQAQADRIRMIMQARPMIAAMKHVMARFTGHREWSVVRPPLEALDAAAGRILVQELLDAHFEMPGVTSLSAEVHATA